MMTQSEIEGVTALHDAFGLTAKEALVLMQLARGGTVEHRRICSIYCDNPHTEEIEARSCVKRLRAKLRGTKIIITSHYGIGYELTGESILVVRQTIKNRTAALFSASICSDLRGDSRGVTKP